MIHFLKWQIVYDYFRKWKLKEITCLVQCAISLRDKMFALKTTSVIPLPSFTNEETEAGNGSWSAPCCIRSVMQVLSTAFFHVLWWPLTVPTTPYLCWWLRFEAFAVCRGFSGPAYPGCKKTPAVGFLALHLSSAWIWVSESGLSAGLLSLLIFIFACIFSGQMRNLRLQIIALCFPKNRTACSWLLPSFFCFTLCV